jgi:hypothetical protein
MPRLDQLPNVATGTPSRRAASCPPTDAASLTASALNSCVYCLLGSLPSFISILRTSEVTNFVLYVKSRQGQVVQVQAQAQAQVGLFHGPDFLSASVRQAWSA